MKRRTKLDLSKLKEPFRAEDIEWRLQQCGEKKDGGFWGKCLAYITSRAVQERLDEVCGTDGWRSEVRKDGNAYLCTLSIRIKHEDGSTEWISRTDGADATDIESVKGGISSALKRAAVQFGVGRYLYDLEEGWATVSENGKYSGKTPGGKWFRWNPPALPEWALPKGDNSFQGKGKNTHPSDKRSESGNPSKEQKEKDSAQNEKIKEMGNTVISRIGDIMKREENGNPCFTDAEINQIRGVVASTRLTEDGIKELEELEKVVGRQGILLGYYQGQLIGFIGEHLEGSMGILYVFPEYRHRGFGAALRTHLIAKTIEKGYIPFGQVEKGNYASLSLQKKIGMTQSDHLIVWMWK